tara:strand:- start:2459 stop:3007 length:549 start_codon:yes stop_codon:yes gene_type:complete
MKNLDKQIIKTYEHLHQLMAKAQYSTDPRTYRETIASLETGCRPTVDKSGADCHLPKEDGTEAKCERKSSEGSLAGAYTGISWQESWDEQERYIREDKIGNCEWHYFDHFDKLTGALVECYRIPGSLLVNTKLPGLHKQWEGRVEKMLKGTLPKDPRLSFSLGSRFIRTHGEQIIKNGKRIK